VPTILIADDHEANRFVLGRLLTHEGYRVVEATDGASALEVVRAERPDLALTDLLMPAVDGFEFVHRLRQLDDPALARLPVVFITAAYVPEDVLNLARSCGVVAVLGRPAPFDEILQAVRENLAAGPMDVLVPPRREFSLALLRLMTCTVSQKVRSVIPSLAEIGAEPQPHPGDGPAPTPDPRADRREGCG